MTSSEWRTVTLKQVLKDKGYIRGPFGSSLKRYEMKDSGIPVYEQTNAIDNHRNFRYFIDEDKYNTLKRFTVEESDLIISCSGTVGKISIIKENDPKGIISQALLILRVNHNLVIPEFIYYFFSSKIGSDSILSRSSGSVQVNIAKREIIENIRFVLPPLQEQKAIAHILSTLDQKIEINNKINKILEEIAQTLFKHWFVDFEFPNEDGEPYKSSGGLMIDSELGPIPKGWEVLRADEITNINIGKTPPRKNKECFTLDSNDIKWISIKDIGNSGMFVIDSSEYLTESAVKKYNVKIIPDSTIILSFKLTIGRVAITVGQTTTNEAIAHFNIIDDNIISNEYLYLYLKLFDYESLGNTSSIANAVNSKIIKSMKVLVPNKSNVEKFNDIIRPIFNKIKHVTLENSKLEQIHNTLLPKLMSGEIRVPLDIEEQ